MWNFRKKPTPLPIYKRQPIATAAVILTLIGMFILGPIGVIYKGMAEELKQKANNETVILYMQQQKEKDDQQWKAIERIIEAPTRLIFKNESSDENEKLNTIEQKRRLTPQEYIEYKKLSSEDRASYREVTPEVDWSRYPK
jgi:hypothetical protein